MKIDRSKLTYLETEIQEVQADANAVEKEVNVEVEKVSNTPIEEQPSFKYSNVRQLRDWIEVVKIQLSAIRNHLDFIRHS